MIFTLKSVSSITSDNSKKSIVGDKCWKAAAFHRPVVVWWFYPWIPYKLFSILIRKRRVLLVSNLESGQCFEICRGGWERVFVLVFQKRSSEPNNMHMFLFLSLIIYHLILLFLANQPLQTITLRLPHWWRSTEPIYSIL